MNKRQMSAVSKSKAGTEQVDSFALDTNNAKEP